MRECVVGRGVRVQVEGGDFKVRDEVCRVQGAGCKVQHSGSRVQGEGLE